VTRVSLEWAGFAWSSRLRPSSAGRLSHRGRDTSRRAQQFLTVPLPLSRTRFGVRQNAETRSMLTDMPCPVRSLVKVVPSVVAAIVQPIARYVW